MVKVGQRAYQKKLDSRHIAWTLGLWTPGHFNFGRLDSGRLNAWTLDIWTPGLLDSGRLDAGTLDD